MARLKPDYRFRSVEEVTAGFLEREDIRGLLIDIDNTIVPWRGEHPGPAVMKWFSDMKLAGIGAVLLSNAESWRARRMSEMLKIPFIAPAGKPFKKGYARALALLDMNGRKAAVIGDQVFMDVWGGNRSGLITILVEPISRREFPVTRILRVLEKLVRKPL